MGKSNGSAWWVWINYRDIQDQTSLVGEDNSVFVSSHYMGSLSTLAKVPKEWWSTWNKEGTYRYAGAHCGVWEPSGVGDQICTYHSSLVCETGATATVPNLKQYIKTSMMLFLQ